MVVMFVMFVVVVVLIVFCVGRIWLSSWSLLSRGVTGFVGAARFGVDPRFGAGVALLCGIWLVGVCLRGLDQPP